mmetsp:Transcript_117021/g.331170  ORF Transcript_117021/g.331170 Transcript_117021/m.331170 type:complete len:204 (-) Transcript_117021:103-714(-)
MAGRQRRRRRARRRKRRSGKRTRKKKRSKKGKKESSTSSSSSPSGSSNSSRSGSDGGAPTKSARTFAPMEVDMDVRPLWQRQQQETEALEQGNSYFFTQEQRQQQERQAVARTVVAELARKEREQALQRQKAADEEWERRLAEVPLASRCAAEALIKGDMGKPVKAPLPLRAMTRQKQVAWLWNGHAQELIGGGINLPEDTLS